MKMALELLTVRLCLLLLYQAPIGSLAGTVQSFSLRENQTAVKGKSIQLLCYISQFGNSDIVTIYKSDHRILTGPLSGALNPCTPSKCLAPIVGRYTFSVDSSHVYVNITDLMRSEDEKWWTCALNNVRKDMRLTVNTVPQGLNFDSPPSQDQDLALNSLSLKCSTGCVYPAPAFRWFYTEAEGSNQEWSTAESISLKEQACSELEKSYESTLSLARYTSFPGNLDKNVKFICGILEFPGMTQPLYTNPSVNIHFVVQVKSVTLKYENAVAPSSVTVRSGVPIHFTCTTSESRPTATIVWYIGGVEKQRSNSTFTFTPQEGDHNTQVYCKAFNTRESQSVTSNKATLDVQVQVTSVTLKDGNNKASSTVQVTSGVPKTLTCTTSVSRPNATITWYIGTVKKQQSNSSSTFTFTPENSDHDKQIFCTAFNIQEESEAVSSNKAKLYVQDTSIAQTFYIEGHFGQTNVTVDEHDANIQFKCIVNSHPKFNIKIMFEEDVLEEKINESSLSFSRHDVSCFDAGVYTCKRRDVYGRESTKNITLFVQCSPRPFRQVERNITGYLYSTVTLSVTVIAYPEPGTKGFAWYKEESIGWFPMLSNADLKITSSGLQSNLKLLNVSKEDYGHYKAIVTNTIGTYEQHIFLLEEIGVQVADRECSCQTSDKTTALIVGLSVGVVCCIAIIMYAAYVTILKNRLLREGTKPPDSSGKQVTCANPTFASDVTEPGEASIQQYTDLSRYANTDSNTYDVINKI